MLFRSKKGGSSWEEYTEVFIFIYYLQFAAFKIKFQITWRSATWEYHEHCFWYIYSQILIVAIFTKYI